MNMIVGEMKIFHINTRKWAGPTRWDRVSVISFVFSDVN